MNCIEIIYIIRTYIIYSHLYSLKSTTFNITTSINHKSCLQFFSFLRGQTKWSYKLYLNSYVPVWMSGAEQYWSTSIHKGRRVLSCLILQVSFPLRALRPVGRGTCDCTQVSDGAQCEFSDIMKNVHFSPSEVSLVGWLGLLPFGPSNRWLETCLVVSGSCLVASWNQGSALENVLDLFNRSYNCLFHV